MMRNELMVERPELTETISPSPHTRVTRYGLPCANCKIYYSAELIACPFCECKERVSPVITTARSVVRL
jgi:hypothetical protein